MIRASRIDWSNFSKLRDEKNCIIAAMCKSCKQIIGTVTTQRLQNHRQSCPVPCAENTDVSEEDMEMEENFDQLDIETIKSNIDKKLGKFFYGCNIPFKAVENEYLLDFVKMLCKINFQYKPPCRRVLATTVLSKVNKDIEEERKLMLENTDSVLLVDGWRNKSANKKFLVFTVANICTPQTFLTFFDTSLEKEDGESLKLNIESAIEIAATKYKTKIFAIVSDNDSKIVCGARLSRNSDGEKLMQSTCSSHSANLMMKSAVDDAFLKVLRDVLRIFREPKCESLILRMGGTKLKNYPDTRFCYVRDSCESIFKNLAHLRQICAIEDFLIDDNIATTICNEDFENTLSHIINSMDPICKLVNTCQSPNCNVADATEYWLSLRVNDDFEQLLEGRIEKAIWPVGYAANLLHHRYKGLRLREEQRNKAITFIREHLQGESFQEFDRFIRTRQEFDSLSDRCAPPSAFWSFIKHKFPNLAAFAQKLMVIPASTASLEGYFSNWTYVHNVYRNRLSNLNSSALVDI